MHLNATFSSEGKHSLSHEVYRKLLLSARLKDIHNGGGQEKDGHDGGYALISYGSFMQTK